MGNTSLSCMLEDAFYKNSHNEIDLKKRKEWIEMISEEKTKIADTLETESKCEDKMKITFTQTPSSSEEELINCDIFTEKLSVNFSKTLDDAVIPLYVTSGSVGMDITAVRYVKSINNGDVDIYDTGICVEPPKGYFAMLVERSSLHKKGFTLANSVGIIDTDYRDSIKIHLKKEDPFNKNTHLKLPARIAQIVFTPYVKPSIIVRDRLDETERRGGFGSTG